MENATIVNTDTYVDLPDNLIQHVIKFKMIFMYSYTYASDIHARILQNANPKLYGY